MKQLLTAIAILLIVGSAQAQNRYFLVTYAYSSGTGSVGVSSSIYPSKATITKIVRSKYLDSTINVVILNIMEFKSLTEFSAFFNGSSYYDTIITAKPVVKDVADTGERTWYFRDLKIFPNKGCLTDRINKVMDSALAMGPGKTTLIISDQGVYHYDNANAYTNGRATVSIDIDCYPDGKGTVAEIERGKCE